MKRWLLSIGALGAAGLVLLTLSDRSEPPVHGTMVLPPAPAQVAWNAARTPSRPVLAAPTSEAPPPAGDVVALGIRGHLDDAEVRELHARLEWNGAANPGIWAAPAQFSAVD